MTPSLLLRPVDKAEMTWEPDMGVTTGGVTWTMAHAGEPSKLAVGASVDLTHWLVENLVAAITRQARTPDERTLRRAIKLLAYLSERLPWLLNSTSLAVERDGAVEMDISRQGLSASVSAEHDDGEPYTVAVWNPDVEDFDERVLPTPEQVYAYLVQHLTD